MLLVRYRGDDFDGPSGGFPAVGSVQRQSAWVAFGLHALWHSSHFASGVVGSSSGKFQALKQHFVISSCFECKGPLPNDWQCYGHAGPFRRDADPDESRQPCKAPCIPGLI